MAPPKSNTIAGVFIAIAATVCATVIATAIASWGSTSDTTLETKVQVQNLDRRMVDAELHVRSSEGRITTFETHQRYLRQQGLHTEKKIDALLEHFSVEKPPEPPLPPPRGK